MFLAGCYGPNLYWEYTCENADPEHLGPDGKPDPCHERDVGDLECKVGEFVHWEHGWDSP